MSPHPQLSPRPGLVSARLRLSSKTQNGQALEPERGPQTKSVEARGRPCPAALLPARVPGRTRSAVRQGDGRSEAGLRVARGRARPPGWRPAPAAGPPRGGSGNRHGRPAHRSTAGHLVSSSYVLRFQGLDTPAPTPPVPDPKDELLKYPPTSLASLNTSGPQYSIGSTVPGLHKCTWRGKFESHS